MEEIFKRILVVGLPETGKSSFIQAFDEVLKHPPSSDALCSDGLADDRSYIQDGKQEFLAGEKLERTRQSGDTSVELRFKDPATGAKGRLYLPDQKGETFRDQWINRRWEKNYRESLSEIAGALVFVRADDKSRNDERLGPLTKEVIQSEGERSFEMREASAQVQIVDILQFIAEHGEPPIPLRTVLLISAWDTVGGEGDMRPRNPERFLEREWALLAQYLRANPETFSSKIYGVSAYGGVPGELGKLVEVPPHERVKLVDSGMQSQDITLPIRWLLQLA